MSLRRIRLALIVFAVLAVLGAGFVCGLTVLYPVKYTGIINEFAEKYNLQPELVYAVIHTESRFRPNAVSPKNASGLMQLTKETADWGAETIGLTNYHYDRVFDPRVNIELGTWYLRNLLRQFDGELDTVLAAYNAGSGNVSRWLRDENYSYDGRNLFYIPFGETRRYVERVNTAMPVYRFLLTILNGFL